MDVNVLFTVPRHLVSAGSLILALCCMSAATAENTFSGALPASPPNYSSPSPPGEKNELTLHNAALLALQRNPELAAFAKETRALQG
ncbi:MAG: TolC family protein, partial [Nitrosospira sp.]